MPSSIFEKIGPEPFEQIMDQFPVPLLIAGFGKGPIFYLNQQGRALFQINQEGSIANCMRDFYIDPFRREKFLEAIITGGYVKDFEIEFKDSLGTRFWALVFSKSITFEGHHATMTSLVEITARKRLEQKLSFTSQHDHLTGVFNRRSFVCSMEEEVLRSRRYGHNLSLIMIDIDNFKNVNDRYGHVVGDEVLTWLCAGIQSCLRPADVFGRVGGEEFAILLPETGSDGACKLAERVRSVIETASFQSKTVSLNVTVSLGVSTLSEADDADSLYKRSDDALLDAKKISKNAVVYR